MDSTEAKQIIQLLVDATGWHEARVPQLRALIVERRWRLERREVAERELDVLTEPGSHGFCDPPCDLDVGRCPPTAEVEQTIANLLVR